MKRSGIVVILNSIVGRFGFVLIERHELWRMERDAEDYAEVSNSEGIGDRQAGYFNGLSDYAGKKATMLRQRYTSNKPGERICEPSAGRNTVGGLVGGTVEDKR